MFNKPLPKRDWAKICKESNGAMIMVPEELQQATLAHRQALKEQNERTYEYNRLTAEWEDVNQTYWSRVKKYMFDVLGIKDIYTKDIGVNKDALDEGVTVYDIMSGR